MSYSVADAPFNQIFALENKEDILKFFPENKKDRKQILHSNVERLKHYLLNGVWIDENKICTWAKIQHAEKLSELFRGKGKAVERKLIQYEAGLHFKEDSRLEYIKTSLKFIKQFLKHPTEVGAILPSSARLAKEIVAEIPKDKDAPPRKILEVGPGTGVFTEKIIKRMNPEDRLVLVEFDAIFHKNLQNKFGHIPNVTILQEDINNYTTENKYDFIISGLPLNSFKADFVNKVFEKFTSVIKEGGKISYFEYVGLPVIKRFLANSKERTNFDAILKLKEDFYNKHEFKQATVVMNCPSARVLHHHVKG